MREYKGALHYEPHHQPVLKGVARLPKAGPKPSGAWHRAARTTPSEKPLLKAPTAMTGPTEL